MYIIDAWRALCYQSMLLYTLSQKNLEKFKCLNTRGVPKVTGLPKLKKNYGSYNYQTRYKYNMVSCDLDKNKQF